jgi:hypothetical protein
MQNESSYILLRILDVPCSNLSPGIGYPGGGFSWFSSVHPGECRDSTLKLGHDLFLPNSLQFIIYLLPLIRLYVALVTENLRKINYK